MDTSAGRIALDAFATPAQSARWRPLVEGGASIVVAVSEPDAGSDATAIATKAFRDGDEFVLDGQKKYIAGAAEAEYLWVVVRTGTNGPRHGRFTSLLVPRDTPGIEIQPIIDLAGRHSADKVFFTAARVPVSNLIGEPGDGLAHALFAAHRHSVLETSGATLDARLSELLMASRAGASTATARDRMADATIRVTITHLLAGHATATHRAASALLLASETEQLLSNLAVAAAGLPGTLLDPADETPARNYLHATHATIRDGTSELLRNEIAAELGLHG